jgi:nucleotidyltransferase/DNA polymerase involved in DNA repair
MVACVLIPRFALRVAAGDRPYGPAALAPLAGEREVVGEVSKEAEDAGVRAGMSLGEAFGHCPALKLIPPDPARAMQIWEKVLRCLEGIGAAVESECAGEAFFTVDGLVRLYGEGPIDVLFAARKALGPRVRIAVAPNRFASFASASRDSRPPRSIREGEEEAILPAGALRKFLASLPVAALRTKLEAETQANKLISSLERLGMRTLGDFARLPRNKIADRFGKLGLRALDLASGEDTPLRPRKPAEALSVNIDLPDAVAGLQLGRYLELLVDRLLSDRRRKERTILSLRLSARLAGGGSWSIEQGFGHPTATAKTINLLLAPRLEELPGPAEELTLHIQAFGPEMSDQLELSFGAIEPRGGRVAAAVRAVRAASGPEALLKVIAVDPQSHLPERRFVLAPYPER